MRGIGPSFKSKVIGQMRLTRCLKTFLGGKNYGRSDGETDGDFHEIGVNAVVWECECFRIIHGCRIGECRNGSVLCYEVILDSEFVQIRNFGNCNRQFH